MEYILSDNGFGCDKIGGRSLVNKEECERAAKSLGEDFNGVDNNAKRPKGCIIYQGRHLKWNKHKKGKNNNNYRTICSRKGKRFIVYIVAE